MQVWMVLLRFSELPDGSAKSERFYEVFAVPGLGNRLSIGSDLPTIQDGKLLFGISDRNSIDPAFAGSTFADTQLL